MWVRSQNRKNLGSYDSFAVSERSVMGYQGPEDGEGVLLGVYKDEENALNVLNKIQDHIGNGYKKDIIYQNTRKISQMVFEMPLEEVSE